MRLLVTGGRDFTDLFKLEQAWVDFERKYGMVTTLIVGDARGLDALAAALATRKGVVVEMFRADWKAYGKSAGPIRNKEMIFQGKPDRGLAFAGGAGTGNCCNQMRDYHIPFEVIW